MTTSRPSRMWYCQQSRTGPAVTCQPVSSAISRTTHSGGSSPSSSFPPGSSHSARSFSSSSTRPFRTPRPACWLPIKPGLTTHGLRHGHKTWMAEDGIPEILSEQRLGHEVPGMRGLYAHASERMRDDLKHALQARWEDSLSARAAIDAHSPVPLLDEILS